MRKQFWISLVILLSLCLWGSYENKALEMNAFPVNCHALPEAFDGFVIAQISDLHNAQFGENNRDLLRLLSDTKPDLIVITGDLVDSRHTDEDSAVAFAKEVSSVAPCYYVTGNHEAWLSHYSTLETRLTEAGITVLRNSALSLDRDGQSIVLAGVDDPAFFGEVRFLQKLEDLSPENFCILLSHRPEYFDYYCQAGFDLVLSGHAHGGQFRIPFLGGLVAPGQGFFPEYDGGIYTSGTTTMAVSRGLGNSILPIRLNNPPEILLITLVRQ